MSVPIGNLDTSEQNIYTSGILLDRALYCYIEGTVANYFI